MNPSDDNLIKRIKNSLIVIADGNIFKVDSLYFKNENENFVVTISSVSNDLKNITKKSALEELKYAKDELKRMVRISKDLSYYLKNKTITYRLTYNYGMGSVLICEEDGKNFIWNDKF